MTDPFDTFTHTAFRLETLPQYVVDDEAEDVAVFAAGKRRPRSVVTDEWLADIARTTLAGKRWSRVRIVDLPLTDYLRYEFACYTEAAVVGEDIRIIDRADWQRHADTGDFWLFDGFHDNWRGIAMRYDHDGRWLGADAVTDPDVLLRWRGVQIVAWDSAVPLHEFAARHGL